MIEWTHAEAWEVFTRCLESDAADNAAFASAIRGLAEALKQIEDDHDVAA